MVIAQFSFQDKKEMKSETAFSLYKLTTIKYVINGQEYMCKCHRLMMANQEICSLLWGPTHHDSIVCISLIKTFFSI